MTDPLIDYTARDFNSIREALTNWVKLRFPRDWPEFIDTTVAMAILDIVSYTHAQRAFYYDVQARNCFLETADLPEAVTAIARQLGYSRRLATAASVSVTLYPNPSQPIPITIRQGEQISVGDLIFESSDTYVIPAGQPSWPSASSGELIIFVEGQTRVEEFLSDGTAFQSFTLANPSVIQGSLTVRVMDEEWESAESIFFVEGTGQGRDTFIGTGLDDQTFVLNLLHAIINPEDEDFIIVMVNLEHWAYVPTFTGAPKEFQVSQDIDGNTTIRFGQDANGAAPAAGSVIDCLYHVSGPQKRYVINNGADGTATVQFGDGDSGIIPQNGATIEVTYRIGGGIAGNIARGELDGNIRGYLPSGAAINVRAFNQEHGSGGNEIESLEHVKYLAPRYAQTNRRAVSQSDFVALAMAFRDSRFGAPAFAAARLKQRVPERNLVEVALWSRDSLGRIRTASTPLKQGVKSLLDSRRTIATYVEMIDGEVLYFDIEAAVQLLEGRTISSVLDSVTTKLSEFFNSTFVTPGTDLSLSLVSDKILEVPYITALEMTSVRGSRLQLLDLGQGDGINKEFTSVFVVPSGMTIVPGSFEISAGDQTISDDGSGDMLGDIDSLLTNTIDYSSGRFTVNFENIPDTVDYIAAECRVYHYLNNETTSQVTADDRLDGITDFAPIVQRRYFGAGDGLTVSGQLPTEFLPYEPSMIVFVGGFDYFGAQPGGQLLAYDDGEGRITGDVIAGGTVNYDTGEFSFTWNTLPPPAGYTDYWGYLDQLPDGTVREFEFEVRSASGGGGSPVSLQTLNGIGRSKFVLSDLDTVNVTFLDGYDNSKGIIDSPSLVPSLTNEVIYHDPSLLTAKGTLNFETAPEPASGRDFKVQVAPVTLFLYTPFVAYIGGGLAGYEKIVFCDDEGRVLGDVGSAYPFSQIDFLSGRFKLDLSAPSVAGRQMAVKYDAFINSDCKDIQIPHSTMPTFSSVTLTEIIRTINA